MCGNEASHRPPVRPAARADEQQRRRIQLQPVDSLTITTLVDNIYDVFMPDQGPASRSGPGSTKSRLPLGTMANGFVPDQLVAEHGFSLLLTLTTDGRTHRLLFDCGVSPDGMVENMRRLELDPRDVEAVVLSHGHFDHTAGLDGMIRRLGRANLPVLIHPDFWNRRRVLLPGREPREIPTTSRGALEGAGFLVIEERQPSFLFEDSVLITGEVARTTGKELVVATGCGNAGVVNIARYARRLTGGQPLYALLGGFHLNGPVFEPLIPRVLDELAAMNPGVLVPAHCTGWRAQHAMSARFPDAFVPNTVGTSFHL